MSCNLIGIFFNGLSLSFGTIFTNIMTTFDSTRAETAVIQSAFISVYMLMGIFTGILIKKFGVFRIGICGSVLFSISLMLCFFASSLIFVIICVGVLNGIGLSCIDICATTVISHLFSGKKNQLLYMSLQSISCGIGAMIYPYLLKYLSDIYEWRGALFLIGAINLNAVACCILWKQLSNTKTGSNREHNSVQIAEFQSRMKIRTDTIRETISIEKTNKTDTQASDIVLVSHFPVLKGETYSKTITVKEGVQKPSNTCHININIGLHITEVLCNRLFMLVVFGTILSMSSFVVFLIFVGDIYKDNGLSNDDVSFGLLLLNIFGMIGRLVLGISLQSKHVSTLLVPLISSLVSAVLFVVFPFVKTRILPLALSAVSGIPFGMFSSMFTVVTLKLIGSDLYPIAVGIFSTVYGICNLVFGPLNGLIRDITGSYTASFYTGTGFQLVSAFIFLLAICTRKQQKKEIRRKSTVFYETSF